jgi:glucuronate isomerase
MNNINCGGALYALLDALYAAQSLPKTILYSLNPGENELLDTMIGAFQGPEIAGKIQHGSAWWFNDNKTGMQDHLTSLANLSLLGNFIGMLTDSRSFLSYTRHAYFRRILCELIGTWIENGEYPADMKQAGQLVQDICYYNAKRYFNL